MSYKDFWHSLCVSAVLAAFLWVLEEVGHKSVEVVARTTQPSEAKESGSLHSVLESRWLEGDPSIFDSTTVWYGEVKDVGKNWFAVWERHRSWVMDVKCQKTDGISRGNIVAFRFRIVDGFAVADSVSVARSLTKTHQ